MSSPNKKCLASVAFNKESVKSVNSANLLHNRHLVIQANMLFKSF